MDLDTVADELYALSPDEFTVARDDAAKRADDPALKKAIKSLRRPTVSAHAVNQIVRGDPGAVDRLLTLGDQLRAAMAGNGGDVRALGEQRREMITALVSPELPATIRDDVTATLEAATADPDVGAAVRSGRLVKPLRYAGFGALPDIEGAVAMPAPARPVPRKRAKSVATRPPTKAPGPAADKATGKAPGPAAAKAAAKAAEREAKERDLNVLRQRVLELSGAADDAQRRYDEAARAAVEARALVDRAEEERTSAHKAAREAHAAAEKARRELGRLERS